jgi:excinuclease UvrABC ATPase subunit
MTVDEASQFFATEEPVARPLRLLSEIGLGYLRLGQPATELSGGRRKGSSWQPNYNVANVATRCIS